MKMSGINRSATTPSTVVHVRTPYSTDWHQGLGMVANRSHLFAVARQVDGTTRPPV